MYHLLAEGNIVFTNKFDIRKEGSGGATLPAACYQGYQELSWTEFQGADCMWGLVPNKMLRAAANFVFVASECVNIS